MTDTGRSDRGEKAGNEGVQAVMENINSSGSCGINVAHLGGWSRQQLRAGTIRRKFQQNGVRRTIGSMFDFK